MDLDTVEVFEMAYERDGIYFLDEGEVVAKKCPKCRKVKYAEEFTRSYDHRGNISSHCLKCKYEWFRENPHANAINNAKYRTLKARLPYEWGNVEQSEVLSRFDGGCALTGNSDIEWDHAIPVSTGHGGTTRKNMYPLRQDLNSSKGSLNIFEWFETAKERFNLEQSRFDALIEYLSKLNGMTTKEYRDYVYWCHENPRDAAR